MMDKEELKSLSLANGYRWIYREGGYHYFQSGDHRNGFRLIKASEEDVIDGTIKEMAQLGVSRG